MLALLIVILPVVDDALKQTFSPLALIIVRFLELPVVEIVMSLEIVKSLGLYYLWTSCILAVDRYVTRMPTQIQHLVMLMIDDW